MSADLATAANLTTATQAMQQFAGHRLFTDSSTWEMACRPYQRSLRPQALGTVDLVNQLTADQFMNYESLAAQRILTTVYEQDLVFLPAMAYDGWLRDFHDFYSPVQRALAGRFRTGLERYCFGYLDDYVEVSTGWTVDHLCSRVAHLSETNDGIPLWEKAIRESRDPRRAARMWLVQFAPDFLVESSPMIRNVLGAYGEPLTEWFKIVIDEYGYGVHEKKHSTLFERTMTSVGLNCEPHYYWQYYLATSLAANNFFHYLGAEHRNFFKYVGALVQTETTLVSFCQRAAALLSDVFGPECDLEYFTEHCHIDVLHGAMAFEKVCLPLVEKFGEAIIPDLVWGMAAYEKIFDNADEQFATQISWMDDQPAMFELAQRVRPAVEGRTEVPVAHLDEHFNELSNSHCHNQDELCLIDAGQMYFFSGLDSHLVLNPGDGVVIRNRRQHGADILSSSCQYRILTIGDVRQWI